MDEKQYGKQYYRPGIEKAVEVEDLKKALKNVAESPARWSAGSSLADIQVTITGNEGHIDGIDEMSAKIFDQIEAIAHRLFKYGGGAGSVKSMAEKDQMVAAEQSKGFVNDIHTRLGSQNVRLHSVYDRLLDIAKALNTLEEELFA